MDSVCSSSATRYSKSFWRVPAFRAALIQLSSFGIVLVLALGVSLPMAAQMTIAAAAVLQGVIAAIVSRWHGLAGWWQLIQLLFPAALITTHSLQLPSVIFFAAFVMLLALYWSTFRTQVPFYPSGPAVWKAVEALLPSERPIRFIDIGSGFGGLIFHLARQRPGSNFIGTELAPLPWLASALRNRFRGNHACFLRGDYNCLDFASYDVIFAYLSPAAMPTLWEKARAEMRPGTLLLSYEFLIPEVTPHLISKPVEGGPALYGWYA
jgi:SAM-dependent methyltransferase